MNPINLQAVLNIGVIVLLGVLAILLLGLASRRIDKRISAHIRSEEQRKRLRTLLQAGRSVGHVIIMLVIILEILYEMKINIAPILASAGVAGLALSLGAQTFIKDFFGGVVVLVENQFTVGDVIKIGDLTGTVERITLRATYLRDAEGRRISIPNGDIRIVTNLSTEWARALVTLSVPLHTDMTQVMEALTQAAREAGQDNQIVDCLLAPPEAVGWTDITEYSVRVQLAARTKPGRQWEVAQVLRKYAMLKLYGKQPG